MSIEIASQTGPVSILVHKNLSDLKKSDLDKNNFILKSSGFFLFQVKEVPIGCNIYGGNKTCCDFICYFEMFCTFSVGHRNVETF